MEQEEDTEQEALFYIEGPDERGCVWAHSSDARDHWTKNLGPGPKVAYVMSEWLASMDFDA